MAFRVLEYVMAIYRGQLREWGQQHKSLHGFLFQPVLPVVLYTGTRPWPAIGRLSDLIAGGADFADLAPVCTFRKKSVFPPWRICELM